jgi:hypothetical protein
MDSDREIRRHLHPDFRDAFDPEKHRRLLLGRRRTIFAPDHDAGCIEFPDRHVRA